MVKYEASNFTLGVRFPPFLLFHNLEHIAQTVERRPFKPWVLGSSPHMLNFKRNYIPWVISSAVEQLAVNQKVDGSIPSLPFFKRAHNSRVEYTADNRNVGSSSLSGPKL